MALQVAYADANHYAKNAALVIVRQLEATPPAVATAICGLRTLTDKQADHR